MAKEFSKTFMGYRRENGRVGVRNHVVILPVDDISNAAAEAVGRNVFGTLAIPHSYGRLRAGIKSDGGQSDGQARAFGGAALFWRDIRIDRSRAGLCGTGGDTGSEAEIS